jgi:hypothetical protein
MLRPNNLLVSSKECRTTVYAPSHHDTPSALLDVVGWLPLHPRHWPSRRIDESAYVLAVTCRFYPALHIFPSAREFPQRTQKENRV